ncbi:hypothetical protein [Granulicoccus phenolivorans]|uniref:hypothetical protein n=1 Tax=Granulicoccus phenolivorans TaxID=266854 RepID=UPI00047B5F6D|nr:hypothetical protein [Granulicoccus phenolivorans]
MRVLVVDAANVIGSRPDGWWRDRPGAAARLHAALVAAPPAGDAGWDLIELVLEGRARAGVPVGTEGRVHTVHAAGSGDDEIVVRCRAYAGDEVTLASADRGLIARVPAVTVLGPRTLRDLIGR